MSSNPPNVPPTSGPPPIPPPVNCAAEICCDQPSANIQLMVLLGHLGCPEEYRAEMVKRMRDADLVLLTGELARAIRQIAFGDGTPKPKHEDGKTLL